MTTRPRLIELDRRLLAGLIPLALFALIAAIVLSAEFDDALGFDSGGLAIVESMGYAFIGAAEAHAPVTTENFLVALILIAVLLDAALDGALMLAKRDNGGEQ